VGAGRLGLGGFGTAEIEVHFWGFFGTFFGLEVRTLFEAEGGCVEDSGDTFDFGVEGLDDFIEAATFDGDAVFGAFELGLEGDEAGVGFEVGVAFDDDHEAAEGTTESALGFFELFELGGVGGGVVELDLADGGAGFGDFGEGGFFEVGGAFDGFDEVGDEVGAALVDVLDLGPLGVDGFLGGDEAVVAAHDGESENDEDADDDEERFHKRS
jgi:hypothetical protein